MENLIVKLAILIISVIPLGSLGQEKKASEPTVSCGWIDRMAEFPGGEEGLKSLIKKRLQYPSGKCVEGRVLVTCVIMEDGKAVDGKVVKGLCPECDKEALRIISIMPRWQAATKNNRNIKSEVTIPIVFSLN